MVIKFLKLFFESSRVIVPEKIICLEVTIYLRIYMQIASDRLSIRFVITLHQEFLEKLALSKTRIGQTETSTADGYNRSLK